MPASPTIKRALAADAFWREVPYTVRMLGGYTTGRIDLLFRENDQLVVADFKSDAVRPSAVAQQAEQHRAQAEAYSSALEQATGQRANEVVFIFARAGAEHALDLAS